jgi:hypothetical protein
VEKKGKRWSNPFITMQIQIFISKGEVTHF